jgi:hypothetical protein
MGATVIEYPAHDRFLTVTPVSCSIVKHTAGGDAIEWWEYTTSRGAYAALHSWQARQFAGEPRGWTYHHPSYRHRIDGDPAKEYIRSPADRLIHLRLEGNGDADRQDQEA